MIRSWGPNSCANWESTLSAAGKFTDAVLRCLNHFTTGQLQDNIEVGREIDRLQQLPKTPANESIRLLIPRTLRAIYQLASDRGARHDRLNFDPNPMDASLAVHGTAWVLAELIRFSHSGVVSPTQAQDLVCGIVETKLPVVEEVDGLTFLHRKDVSARDAMLVKLRVTQGRRVSREEIFETVAAHGHTINNARVTLAKLKRARLVHENEDGVRLLAPGVGKADSVIANGSS